MLRRLLDSPATYFVAAGLLLLVAVASQIEVQQPPREAGGLEQLATLGERDPLNLVFIVIDTLRADRLGAYGYERPTSINLDGLARHGILFKKVLSQSSWTKTSMASLWTGAHPVNHGVVSYDDALPEEVVMPAEILREAGYRTAGVVRNGWIAPNFGFAQGFDFYLRPRPGRERAAAQSNHPSGPILEGTDEEVLNGASDFLDNFGQQKFMLYMHMMDVHQYVYDEISPDFGSSYSDSYDKAIHWADRIVSSLYQKLYEIGQIQNTIVVITSDHGEAFREHGSEGHARNLYAEVVDVPWIIGLPFRLEPGIVIEQPVSNVDVWPTLLDMLGLSPLQAQDGRSLWPDILKAAGQGGDGVGEARPQFAYLNRGWGQPGRNIPNIAVEHAGKRLIWWPPVVDSAERALLFDKQKDPGEQENLFREDHPDVAPLLELAREHYESGKSPWGTAPVKKELDEMRLNQLRALGYVLPGEKPRGQ